MTRGFIHHLSFLRPAGEILLAYSQNVQDLIGNPAIILSRYLSGLSGQSPTPWARGKCNDKMGLLLNNAAANAAAPHVISETQSASAYPKTQKYSFPLL